MTSSASVFEKVASRDMTPQAGAELLMKERDTMPRKPGWMPRWVWVVGVVAFTILLAPVLSNRDQRS